MNNLGIQKRVLMIALLPATLMAITLGVHFVVSQLNSLRESVEERGISVVRQLAQASEFGVFSANKELLSRLASSVLLETDVRAVRIRDRFGAVNVAVGKLGAEEVRAQRAADDLEPKSTLSKDGSILVFEAPILRTTMAVDDYSEPSMSGTDNAGFDPVLGNVTVEISLEETFKNQRRIIINGVMFSFIGLLLTSMVAMRIGRSVSDPILKIADGVQQLEKGHLETVIDSGARGEIRILENGINSMAAALQGAQENLQDQVDIATSELRATLQELERKNAELEVERERAHKASLSKSQFLANMSHELRTPLNAIIGYSEMLEEELLESGESRYVGDILKINSAGKHLLALINDILDLSKIEAGKMSLFIEHTEINAICEYTVATIRPLAERNNNRLVLDCPDDIGVMYSDVTKIRQVLFNLLSNACKFTSNGEVSLSVARSQRDGQEWIDFTVSDTGIGMNPEQMEHLFEAFSQADASISRDYGGTGLGLAICRRFTELMEGDIHVDSAEGKGSRFVLSLPAELRVTPVPQKRGNEKDAAIINFADEAKKARRGGFVDETDRRSRLSTVLVIDDDESVHDMLSRLLSKEGFLVEHANNGEAGISKAIELKPEVIVLDVLMPGLDGWNVLTQLKGNPETSEIPVVMLTMVDDRSKGYALGVTDYIYKPVDREKLVTALTRSVRFGITAPILIVDDDANQRDVLKRTLEKEGWETMRAHNGRAALEAVRARIPSLIVLDLMMPEMDGFEFVNRLRQDPKTRDIPVIVLSAMDLSNADKALLEEGVTEILKKGASSRDELLQIVHDL